MKHTQLTCTICSIKVARPPSKHHFKHFFCSREHQAQFVREERVRRFWSKVVKTSGCWKWIGTKHEFGYGHFLELGAHRFSYFLHNGQIPKGKHVLHSCNNPECTNPKHLRIGTSADNVADMHKAGRNIHGLKSHNSKFKVGDVTEIRRIYPIIGSSRKIARMYGVTKAVILDVISFRKYKHDI